MKNKKLSAIRKKYWTTLSPEKRRSIMSLRAKARWAKVSKAKRKLYSKMMNNAKNK